MSATLPSNEQVRLRPVRTEDESLMLEWRNDPWIISLGKTQKAVDPHDHRRWFGKALLSPSHQLHVIQSRASENDNWRDIGLVRFELLSPNEAAVTIYMLRPRTGRGLGVVALGQSVVVALARWPSLMVIKAEIRSDNQNSIRAFRRAGFELTDRSVKDGTITMQRVRGTSRSEAESR